MPEGYYCSTCNKFVLVEEGKFIHPHFRLTTEGYEPSCFVCHKCRSMVYLRRQEESHAI